MENENTSPLKNFSLYVGIITIAVIALIIFAAFKIYQTRVNPKPSPKPLPSPSGFTVPSPSITPILGTQPPSTLPQAGPESEAKNVGIVVDSPSAQTKVENSIIIKGRANVLGGSIQIAVKDSTGQILGQAQALACEADDLCPFEATISITHTTTPTGTIEVYSQTPVNPQAYLQSIPVQF